MTCVARHMKSGHVWARAHVLGVGPGIDAAPAAVTKDSGRIMGKGTRLNRVAEGPVMDRYPGLHAAALHASLQVISCLAVLVFMPARGRSHSNLGQIYHADLERTGRGHVSQG